MAYLSNLYERTGRDIIRMNYLGSRGKQCGLLVAGWEEFGEEQFFESDPLGHPFDVCARTKKLFDSDEIARNAAV